MTALLLDTHTLLWWWTDDERLSPNARAAVSDPENRVVVSAASAWEIATKAGLGRLDEVPGAAERFADLVAADGFEHLTINWRHALRAGGYAVGHRDPFDRILAAQCELEGLTLVSDDRAFRLFGTALLA